MTREELDDLLYMISAAIAGVGGLKTLKENFIRKHIAPRKEAAEDAELNAIADARKDMPEVSVKLEDL